MKLGERIYQYRTAQNMSQGDLAEALDVSRQSVSKWETDSAVPELDKLVKLCGLFGVSLDELVRGVEPEQQAADPLPALMQDRKRYVRLTVGILLLAMSVMVYLWQGGGTGFSLAMAALPAVCGVILLLAKKHPFLWACWGLFLMVTAFITAYKGEDSPLALMFTPAAYQNHLVYDKILVGWLGLALLAALIAATVIVYRRGAEGVRGKVFFLDWKKTGY